MNNSRGVSKNGPILVLRYLMATAMAVSSGWAVQKGGTIPVALLAAGLGVATVWIMKYALIRRQATGREIIQNAVVIGGLALMADSGLAVWQPPASWSGILTMTSPAAAVAALIYLSLATYTLSSRRRHVSLAAGGAVLATPWLFNLLLILQLPSFVDRIAGVITVGIIADATLKLVIGRTAILLVFNEGVALGLYALRSGRLLTDRRLHGLLLIGAAAGAVSPCLANWGSGAYLATMTPLLAVPLALLAAMASQAGLWAQTYLVTGLFMDALRGRLPDSYWCVGHFWSGLTKGAVYTGIFLGLVHAVVALLGLATIRSFFLEHPFIAAALAGPAIFPLLKTVVESFDGSQPFIVRIKDAYSNHDLYWRGLVVGLGLAWAFQAGIPDYGAGSRFLFGAALGGTAFALVNLGRDLLDVAWRGRRLALRPRSLYLTEALMAGAVGGALAWYLDTPQIGVVLSKFQSYAVLHYPSTIEKYVIHPLFSKWGDINLGLVGGGVGLLYTESLAGVINWSIAAPLFSVNLVVLTSIIQRSIWPVKRLFTLHGLVEVVEQAFRVQRWGLWMAPIISSFLKMSPDPTWYNQDGAVRTMVAVGHDLATSPQAFRIWSLDTFTSLLAYDWFRILIFFDHMGLRVATLVNLSFVGVDALDDLVAKLQGYAGRGRVIPASIRRFATWAPLLIPFYIPRGGDWDRAWDTAQAIAKAHPQEIFTPAAVAGGFLVLALLGGLPLVMRRRAKRPPRSGDTPPIKNGLHMLQRNFTIGNGLYNLNMCGDGRGWSRTLSLVRSGHEIDLTRRSEDPQQLVGKYLYFQEPSQPAGSGRRLWSLTYLPVRRAGTYQVNQLDDHSLCITNSLNGVTAQAVVRVDTADPVEVWTVRLTNLEQRPRTLELTTSREWAMNSFEGYRRHPDYNGIHVSTCFLGTARAILAQNRLLHDGNPDPLARRLSPEVAFHAVAPGSDGQIRFLGYEDSRLDFLGQGRLTRPAGLDRKLRTVDDQGLLYTFAPMAALKLSVDLPPSGEVEIVFMDGYARDLAQAARLLARHLKTAPLSPETIRQIWSRTRVLPGFESPRRPAVPSVIQADASTDEDLAVSGPGYTFSPDGTEVTVAWDTPRPWTHVMANEVGYGAVANNQGEIWSFFGNSQQNALTPASLESLPVQVPGQALYLLDKNSGQLLSPSYLPTRKENGVYAVTFGRGYAAYRNSSGQVHLEFTVAVLPDQPAEVRLLKIQNNSPEPIDFRLAYYQQMVLGEIAGETRWNLQIFYDEHRQAMYFSNPKQNFVAGWAFVAMSLPVRAQEMFRNRFIGDVDRDLTNPYMVETGRPNETVADDGFRVAALLGDLTVAPGAEEQVAFVIGQAKNWEHAGEIIEANRRPEAAAAAIERTKAWWATTLSHLRVETNNPGFDRQVNDWLPYQTLTARLWGRTGANQRSGGYGYRDQLQDVLPFLFLNPALARKQILFHAAQQFHDGDVMQWWHPSPDGRTGLGARNRASDPHLWLPYLTYRYLEATGDRAILEERTHFLEGERIPVGEEGTVFAPLVSTDAATLYQHCRRAIDFTLERLGSRGLPLMGTGDWNDGLNLVGYKGQGESVWLGLFLYDVMRHFAPLIEEKEGAGAGRAFGERIDRLRKALESMWRDGRYARAVTDDGRDLIMADALTGSWPIIAGLVDLDRGVRVVETALKELEKENLILLLTPAFSEESPIHPGKISHYAPGVRENGGQYSHGSSWLVDALTLLADMARKAGDTQRAAKLLETATRVWTKISPLAHIGPEEMERYGLAPHQQPADIYWGPGYEGRGGWSWYTGSAARMLVGAYQILGLAMKDGQLIVPANLFEPKGGIEVVRLTHEDQTHTRD